MNTILNNPAAALPELHMAPLQGYTEAEYRRAWLDVYGPSLPADTPIHTYTPFLRVEKGEVWKRSLRDAISPLNPAEGDIHPAVVPQIIVGNMEEFTLLTSTLRNHGFSRIDINLGCPFPPHVKKGRGAGALLRPDFLRDMAAAIAADPSTSYSIKLRAGVTDHAQWRPALEIFNAAPLRHITLHPRIAADQYRGTASLEAFAEFAAECLHPLIYNGDLADPAHVAAITAQFPTLRGIMLGRGLLARPSLPVELATGTEWTPDQRLAHILRLHARYRALLEQRIEGGDHQLLTKLHPFWEYLEAAIGRKPWKLLRKATTLPNYAAALSTIG